MYYSEDALKQLAQDYADVGAKYDALIENYVSLGLKDARALEFARQGFPRRLKVMVRCMINVFEGIPPARIKLPSRDELTDATINIQSFVFNVFGAIDNLAWIWVLETGRRDANGNLIRNTHVGLQHDNTAVRSTLSQSLQRYLDTLNPWFDYLTDLRHALAHRIPLYIPPYVIEARDEAAYRDFDAKMAEAAKKHDFEEYDRLSAEQLRLGRFRPWVQHSFEEKAKPVVFHAQMLTDFNTVDQLAHKMLDELVLLHSGD